MNKLGYFRGYTYKPGIEKTADTLTPLGHNGTLPYIEKLFNSSNDVFKSRYQELLENYKKKDPKNYR